ncbi:hypothetical protein, partial [Vibrio cholerae]|uniref:hypothetical protein n=1 Tax=Vibrio cholerae TaxID=666 RepID=UPI001C8D1787
MSCSLQASKLNVYTKRTGRVNLVTAPATPNRLGIVIFKSQRRNHPPEFSDRATHSMPLATQAAPEPQRQFEKQANFNFA